MSRDSAVGTTASYGLDPGREKGLEFDSRYGQECSVLRNVQTGSGIHSATYQVGTRGPFPGIKRPGHESDHTNYYRCQENMGLYTHVPYGFTA
jgi:hypothetical protein